MFCWLEASGYLNLCFGLGRKFRGQLSSMDTEIREVGWVSSFKMSMDRHLSSASIARLLVIGCVILKAIT
jgi:hypothetical protein